MNVQLKTQYTYRYSSANNTITVFNLDETTVDLALMSLTYTYSSETVPESVFDASK